MAKDITLHQDKLTDRWVNLCIIFAVLSLYFVFMNSPIYGDGYGYGYRTAGWMEEHGLQPIPAGSEKGENCMGHPAFFFWLWAILMRVFGRHIWVAHLLPAVATWIALYGTYKLGKTLAGVLPGILSALALLVSPLFITEAFRPLPDSALIAAVVWSLYYYRRRNDLMAALLCFLSVIFREQGILLAGAYFFSELFRSGIKKPLKLLLWCSPLLVIAFMMFVNHFVSGWYLHENYIGKVPRVYENWLAHRFYLFGGHLLAENYRWIPFTALSGALLWRSFKGIWRYIAVPAVILLTLTGSGRGTPILIYQVLLVLTALLIIVKKKNLPKGFQMVSILFILLMIFFHVFIMALSHDTMLDLLRYVIGVYPALILLLLCGLAKNTDKRIFLAVSVVFIILTGLSNRSVPYINQSDTTLAGLALPQSFIAAVDTAEQWPDTLILPPDKLDYMLDPGLGYVSHPLPVRTLQAESDTIFEGVSYTLMIPHFNIPDSVFHHRAMDLTPRGSRMTFYVQVTTGAFKTDIYRIAPFAGDTIQSTPDCL